MNFADPINALGAWLENLLLSWNLAQPLVTVIMKIVGAGVVGTFSLVLVIFTIWMERKLYARIQDRLGPNRVGPWGIFQTFPDMIKIFTKEYITPTGADKVVYNLAPVLAVSAVILIWAVMPFADNLVGTELNVGVLYLVAVGAIGTLGIIMAGWSSNNKYALLGAFRAVAQMVSFEVPMVLALIIPVILAQSMGINDVVRSQGIWFVVFSPLAMLLFFLSSQAEIGRAPFDLVEAESELIAGYQTEYSGLKFGMFYVGEFVHAFTVSAMTATLFFGGWRGPGAETVPILGAFYLMLKAFAIYFVVILMRISLPRLRIDQMLNFNWKFLTPLALVLLMATAIIEKSMMLLKDMAGMSDANYMVARALTHLLVNVLIVWGTIELLRRYARIERQRVAEPRPVATMTPRQAG